MFDGIIYNMISDMLKNGLIAGAAYLGLTGSTSTQFIAGGMAVFVGLWQWYENGGHQKIVNALKKTTNTVTVTKALSVAAKMVPFIMAVALLGMGTAHAQMVTKNPPALQSLYRTHPRKRSQHASSNGS